MKSTALILLIFSLFFLSCKENRNSNESSALLVSSFQNPATIDSQTPRLFSNGKELYMSWVTLRDGTDHLSYASYSEGNWSNPEMIAYGNDWFTNWADFPAIAEHDGSLVANFLQKSAKDTYTYDIKMNYKHRDSVSWKENFILHQDETQSEHGFVSVIPSFDENEFFVTWLDGRNTVSNEHTDHENGDHGGVGAMTLRGAYLTSEGTIVKDTELDARICDCCQTSAAMTSNGPVVVYRDRSEEEVRDISIVREVHNTWTTPKSIHHDNWKIAGCPVNGPAIDALGTNVAVAWFTVIDDEAKVQIAFSKDAGENFGDAIQVNAIDTLGRVDVIILNENEAVISWMERENDDTSYIQLAKVSSDGTIHKPITIQKTNGSRATGFPQIEFLEGKIYAAMTLLGDDDIPEIKTASINVTDL